MTRKITITDLTGTLSARQLADIRTVATALVANYPPANPGNVIIKIRPDDTFEHGDDIGYEQGNTVAFTAHIALNVRIFTDTTLGDHMPVVRRVPVWVYVLAHEYGHAFTSRAEASDGRFVSERFVNVWGEVTFFNMGMSGYGASDPIEGYAEAFAEWTLTGGHTRDAAAREYADRFGWVKPGTPIYLTSAS